MKSCLRQTLPPDAYMGPGASTQPLNSFVTSDFTGRHRSIIADAALYRHGSIEKARTQLRRSSTLPQLKVPPNTRRKSRKGLHTLRLLTPMLLPPTQHYMAQRCMIPVTRHMGALTQMLLQVALKGSAKSSRAQCPQ